MAKPNASDSAATDRVAIITGAGSGIGFATAERLAGQGWGIVAVDRDADRLQDSFADRDGFLIVTADVRYPDQVRDYVVRAQQWGGRIDGFFNNAGIEGPHEQIGEMDLDAWRTTIDINLHGAAYGLHYVLPAMRPTGGAVVNTGSVLSLTGAPGAAAYATTKHAILALTRCAAAEEAVNGITVNCLCPGPIDTPLQHRAEQNVAPEAPGQARSWFESMVPAGRYGSPDEIAGLVSYLLGPDARFVTGASIAIDGGMSCSL